MDASPGATGGKGAALRTIFEMAAALDACCDEIAGIQRRARVEGDLTRPTWPMIVLRTPKGWTSPGEVGGHSGPGSTQTPIALVHATLQPGAELDLPWRPDFNALVYALAGRGSSTNRGRRRARRAGPR